MGSDFWGGEQKTCAAGWERRVLGELELFWDMGWGQIGRFVRKTQVSQNRLDGVRLQNGRDNFQGTTAMMANSHVNAEDAGQKFGPPLGARGRRCGEG
jgi:hypothetical protein